MMVPIGLAVISEMEHREGRRLPLVGQSIMLAIAYGANVGGVGTLIGTPPNMAFAGFVDGQYKVQIGFARYLLVGIPFVLLFLPIVFAVLAWLCRREKVTSLGPGVITSELSRLGPTSRHERIVLCVFLLTCAAWTLNEPIRTMLGLKGIDPGSRKIVDYVKGDQLDAVFALVAGAALFLTGTLRGRALRRMPWGVLILLGGSYALAVAVKESRLSHWLIGQMGFVEGFPPLALMLAVTLGTVFLSAFTANTAAANIMMLLVTDLLDPRRVLPARATPYLSGIAISSSCDFMLPCGTPPNAVVFGTRYVKIRTMAGAGALLDVAAAIVVALWVWFGARHLLGI
jgi:sodium-dependent dicarboxylate transporter 2/3/5